MIYWIAFYLQKIFYELYLSLKACGQEKIPRHGGYIIACNHLSNLDPMLVGVASGRRLSFVAKKSLFKNWFVNFFLYQFGAFPVKRGAFDMQGIKEALRRLKAQQGVVMFPQGGRRSEDLDTSEVKAGVGFLAIKAQVPVVPAFIMGSDKAMPKGFKGIQRAPVSVFFGNPVQISGQLSYQEVAQRVYDAMKALASESKPST
ncbi:MAG TPA: lysophospholipid acyltransferase family protein [Candidatus Omnitrophota bacterium]|nr:lysophospholipid acyltransferase family protein [Candidatus Omnitrophota bacterium]HQL40743.1 lysophospholipid acyltransferase family protein [Candidatus Omnitrophota bacterium]